MTTPILFVVNSKTSYVIIKDGRPFGTLMQDENGGPRWVARDVEGKEISEPDVFRHDIMSRIGTLFQCSVEVVGIRNGILNTY